MTTLQQIRVLGHKRGVRSILLIAVGVLVVLVVIRLLTI